ncbi:hypothetical protein PCC7424_5005 [Gloeothece citriformis PCC 7424]|uniref:Uncharacterized protein n=1 Tax=Gloeothece citriformis (strain PCC 7424) TaxID=65393 RepID=B7KFN3_GLOC7|nr:hypothetical protein [Gloeothece citriformis]ACK73358.1 hypothetical protein PCC7424_5005 [Gloeothece citriformis PCC 7424]
MVKDLSVEEFCNFWIPKLYGISKGKRGYKKACIEVLSYITQYSPDTCANWVSTRKRKVNPPRILLKYLRLVHQAWLQEEFLMPKTLENLKKDLNLAQNTDI